MKRTLSIILTLCMILSLAAAVGCSGEKPAETTAPTQVVPTEGPAPAAAAVPAETAAGIDEAALKASKPCEYIKEKLAAGMEVKIALVAIEFSSTTFSSMDADYKQWFEELGFTYMSADHNMNTPKQIELIENYVTMGCAAIITVVFGDEIADTVAKAIESGTYVTLRKSMVTFPVSFNAASDPYGFGAGIADMVKAWIDYRYPGAGPGEAKYATVDLSMNPIWSATGQGIQETLAADGRFSLAFTESTEALTVDSGYGFAETALMSDKDIRTFIAYSYGQAMGVSNYIMAQPDLDKEDFAVFCADADPQIIETIDASAKGENIFRGYGTEGGQTSHQFLFDNTLRLLYGEIEPGLNVTEPKYYYTSFGYFLDTNQ